MTTTATLATSALDLAAQALTSALAEQLDDDTRRIVADALGQVGRAATMTTDGVDLGAVYYLDADDDAPAPLLELDDNSFEDFDSGDDVGFDRVDLGASLLSIC